MRTEVIVEAALVVEPELLAPEDNEISAAAVEVSKPTEAEGLEVVHGLQELLATVLFITGLVNVAWVSQIKQAKSGAVL